MTPAEQLAAAIAEIVASSAQGAVLAATPLPTDLLRLQECSVRLEMPLIMVKRLVRRRVLKSVRLIGADGNPVKREGLRVPRIELDRYIASLPEGRPMRAPVRLRRVAAGGAR